MSAAQLGSLRPFLKANVDAFRHVYRGEVWYLFHDRALDKYYRISAEGARIIGSLDGRRTLDEVRDAQGGGEAPDEAETARFAAHLRQLGLLRTGEAQTAESIARQRRDLSRRKLKGMVKNPLSLRLPLFDPTALLDRLGWLERLVFSRAGLWIFAAIVGSGSAVALWNWHAIASSITDQLLSVENLALTSIVYVAMKVVHELAHGLALRHFGGEVRRVGLIFVLLMPIPYVDASASSAFSNKRWRMLVAGAGILSELLMGAIAAFGWALAEPGLLRTICFDVLMISGFSTLLFNGNPLQRFDGYYILCDAVEIPDLGSRSTAYIAHLARRHLLGSRDETPPRMARGERAWFLVYGPASFVYRVALTLSIALFAAETYPVIGAALAIWALAGAVLAPVAGLVKRARASKGSGRRRLLLRAGLVAGGLGAALFLVPVPSAVVAPGIVWLPESASVRASGAGEVTAIHVAAGAAVRPGQTILSLSDEELDLSLVVAEARLREAEATFRSTFMRDRAQSGIEAEKVAEARKQRDAILSDLRRLDVRAATSGTLIYGDPVNLPHSYVAQGTQLAMVWNAGESVVRCFLPLWEIERIGAVRGVTLRFAFDPGRDVAGEILRVVPAATVRLPSPVLSVEGGGPYAIASGDPKAPTIPQAVFEIVVRPLEPLRVELFQGRADVRFALDWEPAGFQIYRAARLVFLRQLDV